MTTVEPLPRWSRWAGLGLLAAVLVALGWGIVGLVRGEEREAAVFAATVEGLEVTVSIESCNAEDIDLTVDESDTEVVVGARVTNPADGDDCADGATFTLVEPLGERRLVDGVTGRELHCEPDGSGRSYCTREPG